MVEVMDIGIIKDLNIFEQEIYQAMLWLSVAISLKVNINKKITQYFAIQCTLDIATGLRHGGRGRYSQRGRYLCNARAPSFIGIEVAIGSAAAISKIAVSNGYCATF